MITVINSCIHYRRKVVEEKRLTDEKYYYTITYGCAYVAVM